MAKFSDIYSLTSKASTGGIDAGKKALKGLGSTLASLAKIGPASLRAIGRVTGSVVRGLGAIGLAFEGAKRLAETFKKGLEVMAKASPAFARQLGRVQWRLDAIKNALAKKAGDALAPALERIVKALDSPKVQKFIDLIGKGLQKALTTGLGVVGRLLVGVGDLFTEFEDGSRPIDSVRGIVVTLAKAFGLSDEAAFELGKTIKPIADFIEKQLIPGLLTLGKTLLEGVGQAWTTLQSVVGTVWNWLKTNVFDPLFAAVQTIAATIGQKWGEIQSAFNTLWQAVGPIIQVIIDKLASLWQNVLPNLVAAFQGILDEIGPAIQAVAEFISTHFEEIKAVVENVFGAIQTIIQTVIDVVGGIIKAFLQVLQGDWEGVWETIRTVAETVWEAIKSVVESAVKIIEGVMKILGDALREPWEAITGFVEGVWQGIKDFVRAGINAVIDFINGLLQGYNDSFVSDIFGDVALIARVESLKEGGIVNRPMAAIVGDNPISSEVVAPLHELMGMIQQAISSTPAAAAGGGMTVQLTINGPFGPGYTPEQAGAAAANGFIDAARRRGQKV